jgi:hypothetical protein
VTLRGAAGATRTVTFERPTAPFSASGMYDRARGTLDDLGAGDVYYVTLNGSSPHAAKAEDVPAIAAALSGKRGVVLDMRGYPNLVSWSVLALVAPPTSQGPQLSFQHVAPSLTWRVDSPRQTLGAFSGAVAQVYTGPVVLLVGSNTQSQAEHLTSFFRSTARGKLVGGATSGANGNITGVQLAGGYTMLYTGMHVEHPDGGVFHAVGHVPDVAVAPSIEDLRAGRDAVLARAVAELAGR